jgi:hypothetical protein
MSNVFTVISNQRNKYLEERRPTFVYLNINNYYIYFREDVHENFLDFRDGKFYLNNEAKEIVNINEDIAFVFVALSKNASAKIKIYELINNIRKLKIYSLKKDDDIILDTIYKQI